MYLIPRRLEIEKRRSQKGLSAYGLAMKAGLDKKAIYRIESGDSERTHNLRAQAIPCSRFRDITSTAQSKDGYLCIFQWPVF